MKFRGLTVLMAVANASMWDAASPAVDMVASPHILMGRHIKEAERQEALNSDVPTQSPETSATTPVMTSKGVDRAADAEGVARSGPSYTVDVLRLGDRVTSEVALGHVIEVAYYGAMYQREFEGFYFFQAPSEIKYETGKVALCETQGRLKIDIATEERIQIANSTTICPTTSLTACNETPMLEYVTLETNLINSTGHVGLEDGSQMIVPSMYEYGLYYDAPGITPANIVSGVNWSRSKEHDRPNIRTGDFLVTGYLAPNKTCTQRKELILKRIELTGSMSTIDCLGTEGLDDTHSDSLHFTLTACAHKENNADSECETRTFGPYGYQFVVEHIHGKGLDDHLCRFDNTEEFCLMTLGLDRIQLSSYANFVATPAAYTNVYEDINCVRHEARSMTEYLPSLGNDEL